MTILTMRHDTIVDLSLSVPELEFVGLWVFFSGCMIRGDIAYWIFNYMPHWEAASKEAQMLLRAFSAQFTTRLFSLNRSRSLKWRGPEKYLPLPESLAALPLLYQIARFHRINHLFTSGGERLLAPWISQRTSILTICKEPASIDALERNRHHLARFRYVVVESTRHQDIMRQFGIEDRRIKIIYPPADISPYKPAQPPFKLLFASSPTARHKLLSRGIFLMLRAAERLPDVQFILVWRRRHHGTLRDLLERGGMANISVVDGYVEDMGALYDAAHMTVLPGLDHASFKPTPHSALDSLGRGKPLLITPTSSIAHIVAERRCGIVFEPTISGFENAVREAMVRYDELQKNCHPTARACFSRETFIRKYQLLYEELLQGSQALAGAPSPLREAR